MSYKKKLVIMGLLLLALLTGIGFRSINNKAVQHDASLKKPAKEKTETSVVKKEEGNRLYRYKNFDGLYFLTDSERRSLQGILENWLKQNKYSCTLVTVLGNINSAEKGSYKFYVQLNDEQGTVLEANCTEQNGVYAYSFKKYIGDIKNIELIGGADPKMEQAVTEAPADGYVPDDKPTDDSPIIINNSEKLPKTMAIQELRENVMEELEKKEDLRRVFTVESVKEDVDKVEVQLKFQTNRPGKQGLEVIKNIKDSSWQISWET